MLKTSAADEADVQIVEVIGPPPPPPWHPMHGITNSFGLVELGGTWITSVDAIAAMANTAAAAIAQPRILLSPRSF
jgi:hypothetical protein